MGKPAPALNPFWYSFGVLLTIPSAWGQLLSCADIGYPVGSNLQSTCQVNGSRVESLGLHNFTTSLMTEPLSWTVGYVLGTPNNGANGADQRFHYLGTPRGLDLNLVSSLSGCALSFVGIGAGLSFVPFGAPLVSDMDQVSGTCDDAMGAACVSDLVQQSRNYTNALNSNGTFQCSSLAEMLKENPPVSRSTAGTWGDITVRDLTGAAVPSKIELGDCHPTVNQTYDIRIMDNTPKIFNHDFFNDITPILTVFAPVSEPHDDDVGPTISTSEAYLSCMKPVSNKQTAGLVVGGNANKNLSGISGKWLLFGVFLWSVLW